MKGRVACEYEDLGSYNCIYNSLIVCGLHFIIFCFFYQHVFNGKHDYSCALLNSCVFAF